MPIVALLLALSAGCGRSAGNMEASDALQKQLAHLSLEQLSSLGPYRADSNLTLITETGDEVKKLTEDYVLQWDNWGQYHYNVKKGGHQAMDVTIWSGTAYQRQLDGRLRTRQNPEEFNYYLRQTWNQWDGAVEPFKQVLVYKLDQTTQIEGRPADKYLISLKPQIDPNPTQKMRLRQAVEHDKVEGAIWIDRASGVPLQADFHGEYRLVRFSRRPGRAGEEARYKIDFSLRRSQIGQQQILGPPEALARP